MSPVYLGIDVGGTASRWTVIDDAGALLARGAAPGATGHLFVPAEREKFERMIVEVASGVDPDLELAGIFAGVTGLGPQVQDDAHALIGNAFGIAPERVSTNDDMQLAYLAAFERGQGHMVSAGTGSIGLHIKADGSPIRVGGRGLLIDDGGSGTWIALKALDELYRLIDMKGRPEGAEELAAELYSACGGNSWDAVRGFVYGSDRGRIGALAQVVAKAASAGDPLAQKVLDQAVLELARLGQALLQRGGALPLAYVGGIIDLHPSIRPGLVAALPDAEVRFPKIDAALRAAQLARERAQTFRSS
ncbi:MAG TPA: BadF/BadG/BcrA/BcrD ATPase family protein [Devosiaceae bacterium]|jgi:N-acetylglucosamine kinase-like BadF-type ATPase